MKPKKHILICKTISKREPTRKIPCTKYEHKTCLNIEDNKLVLEEFNCKIPILYNGKHLDEWIPKETSNCTNKVTKLPLNQIMKQCQLGQKLPFFLMFLPVIKSTKSDFLFLYAKSSAVCPSLFLGFFSFRYFRRYYRQISEWPHRAAS